MKYSTLYTNIIATFIIIAGIFYAARIDHRLSTLSEAPTASSYPAAVPGPSPQPASSAQMSPDMIRQIVREELGTLSTELNAQLAATSPQANAPAPAQSDSVQSPDLFVDPQQLQQISQEIERFARNGNAGRADFRTLERKILKLPPEQRAQALQKLNIELNARKRKAPM